VNAPSDLYDRCVETAREFLDKRPEQAYIIEHGEAIDLGVWVGVTGAIMQLKKEGLLRK
jgi:hypothetical protein